MCTVAPWQNGRNTDLRGKNKIRIFWLAVFIEAQCDFDEVLYLKVFSTKMTILGQLFKRKCVRIVLVSAACKLDMTYNSSHIGDFLPGKSLAQNFSIGISSAILSILYRNTTHVETCLTWILIKSFNFITAINKGLLDSYTEKEISVKRATKCHKNVEVHLKRFIGMYNELNDNKFFNNSLLEDACENAMLSFYRIESHFQAIKTTDIDCSKQDASLIKYATHVSLGSLEAQCLTLKKT